VLTTFPLMFASLRSILRRHEVFLYASLRSHRLVISGVVALIFSRHFSLSDSPPGCRLVVDRLGLDAIIFESVVNRRRPLHAIVIEHVCAIVIVEVLRASQRVVAHILRLWLPGRLLLILLRGWYVLTLLLIVALLRFRLVLRRLFLFFIISLLNWRRIIDNNFPVRLLLLIFRLIDLLFSLRLIFGLILVLVTFRRLLIALLGLFIVILLLLWFILTLGLIGFTVILIVWLLLLLRVVRLLVLRLLL
jgi:hypothetical protein